MDRETLDLPAEQLARHAMHQAYESRDEHVRDSVDSDVDDWNLYESHKHIDFVEEVSTDTTHFPDFDIDEELDGLHVVAVQSGSVSERTSRGTRLQPPEYRSHDVRIRIEAWWFPHPDQLEPLTALHVHQLDAPLAPPAPDVHEHMYDSL